MERPKCGFLRGAIAIDGQFQFPGERQQAGNVVGMLMGNQDAGKIFWGAANGREALADLTRAESRVHEDAGFVGFHVSAIATGSAAKNSEANSHG